MLQSHIFVIGAAEKSKGELPSLLLLRTFTEDYGRFGVASVYVTEFFSGTFTVSQVCVLQSQFHRDGALCHNTAVFMSPNPGGSGV